MISLPTLPTPVPCYFFNLMGGPHKNKRDLGSAFPRMYVAIP